MHFLIVSEKTWDMQFLIKSLKLCTLKYAFFKILLEVMHFSLTDVFGGGPWPTIYAQICSNFQWFAIISMVVRRMLWPGFWKRSDGSIFVVYSKIQNLGQNILLTINTTAVLKRKSDKGFKKEVSIGDNPFYKSELLKVWAVVSPNYSLKLTFFSVKLVWKSQKQHLVDLQSCVTVSTLGVSPNVVSRWPEVYSF